MKMRIVPGLCEWGHKCLPDFEVLLYSLNLSYKLAFIITSDIALLLKYTYVQMFISAVSVCKLFDQIIFQGFKFHEISTFTNFTEFIYKVPQKTNYTIYASSSFMAT